ncbi:MAG: hypothetical protein JNN12_15620 [Bacteroidetes Order II. Incertae sedis bacterium]|nr:hypothetical protein [Bacteroidetes Order II. bacterium]
MHEQTASLVQRIHERLVVAARRLTLANFFYGLLFLVVVGGSIWLLLTGLEAWLWLPTWLRSALFFLFCLSLLGGIGWFLVRPLVSRPSEEVVAKRIGERFPEVSDRLTNLLHLSAGRHSQAPNPLLNAAVERLSNEVSVVPFEQVENFSQPKHFSKWLLVPLLAFGLFIGLAPQSFLSATERLLAPGTTFEPPALFRFVVEPGNTKVVKGASLPMNVRTYGTVMPIQATLEMGLKDEEHTDKIPLSANAEGRFTHQLTNIRQTTRYRMVSDGIESAWYTIEVLERPAVRSLNVSINPPSYSGLGGQRLDNNVGDVVGLPGTLVNIRLQLNQSNITEANLLFDDGEHLPLTINGEEAYGAFNIRKDGNYQVLLRNAHQITNENTITYAISTMRDAPPSVVITEPSDNQIMSESQRELVVARVTDDYGFSKASLCWRLAERIEGQTMPESRCIGLGIKGRELDQELAYEWLVPEATGLDLREGDVLEYYIQVWDNNAVAGYQTARSAIFTLRIPSLTQQYKELEEKSDNIEDQMRNMQHESSDMNQMFNELQQQLRQKQAPEWNDERNLQRLMENKQQMENRAQELKDQIQELNDQMQEQNLVNEKTLEMFRELERIAEEIKTPALQEALRRLQEAMRQMNPQQMERAMQEYKNAEQQMRQRLERLKELYKQLKANAKLDELANKAEQMADKQEQLSEKINEMQKDGKLDAKEQADLNQMAEQQQRNAQEMKEMEAQMGELNKDMQEMKNGPKEEMKEMNKEAQQDKLSNKMEQNKEQMKDQKMQQAKQGQQQMKQRLMQMAQQMRSMQEQQQQQQVQLNVEALRRVLDDVLTLSQEQESLRNATGRLQGDNPRLRRIAQQQSELRDGLKIVSDTLLTLSKRIPKMNAKIQTEATRAQGEMSLAVSMATERQVGMASGNQKAAMTHLNELALLLSELLSQMQAQAGPGSMSMQQMMDMLQQMSNQQQRLNQQIQQLLNEMQGDRMSQSQQERASQISQQQQAIKRQLEQMMQNPEFNQKVLGDMKRVSDDMDETIRELKNRNITRQTTYRQNQILSRLLEATRSLNTRGREEKRQSERAKERNQSSPMQLKPQDRATQIRRDLIRAIETGYAPDYERLIRKYFELMQQGK